MPVIFIDHLNYLTYLPVSICWLCNDFQASCIKVEHLLHSYLQLVAAVVVLVEHL